uniref:Cytochrome P450 2B4 n=1 Tax=Magallana gigas TaxID=29159 RepID=K1QW52_MAGGI
MLSSLWTTGASLAKHIDLTTFLVITLLFLIALCVISTPRSDIPGPLALPFVGNLMFFLRVGTKQHEEYLRLYKTYGDIFRLFFGNRMLITICGYDTICDAFVRQGSVLSDRPAGLFHPGPGYEKSAPGVLFTSGGAWKRNRRFAMQTMRDIGMGKKRMDEVIADEASVLCADIALSNGIPIDNIRDLLGMSASNIVHYVLFGYRCNHDNERFLTIIKAAETIFKSPNIRYRILPKFVQNFLGTSQEERLRAQSDVSNYLKYQIEEHEKTFDRNNIRDLVDRFLTTIPPEEDSNQKLLRMYLMVLELFLAGTDTTATQLEWTILYMMGYPKVQERCYEEIEKVVGLNRSVYYSDRNTLPFVEATLLEVQRLSSICPRICLGETLTKTALFIIFANLIQKFKFCKASPDDELSFDGVTGQIRHPGPYRVRAEPRN